MLEMRLVSDTYECAQCHGVFTKAWSDEEAIAEAEALWTPGEMAEEGAAVICDDCFKTFYAWVTAE